MTRPLLALFTIISALLFACSGEAPCGPSTCVGGCCNSLGACVAGNSDATCGAGGAVCQSCAAGTTCGPSFLCVPRTNGGGGGGGGGSGDGGLGCTSTGCPSGQECDPLTDRCALLCPNGANAECPQPGFCDQTTKRCSCSPNTHLCGAACLPNDSVSSCGSSCTACPVPANGTATCDGTACGITCPSSLKACGSTCASCPANATSTACSGEACVATGCGTGYRACAGACSQCPTGATAFGCSGTTCVATGCSSGNHVCSGQCVSNFDTDSCGSSCTPCPAPAANGYSSCSGSTCSIVCNSNYTQCGTSCVTCPSGAGVQTTGCSGSACVVTACKPGYANCGNTCALCPEGATTTSCSGTSCIATACTLPFTKCGNSCCGLRTIQIDDIGQDDTVGVAHLDGGVGVAWTSNGTYQAKVRFVPDAGAATTANIGGSYSYGVSYGVDRFGTEWLVYINLPNLYFSDRVAGNVWVQPMTVMSFDGGYGGTTSMAIGPVGRPRVVLSDGYVPQLMYVERGLTAWSSPVTLPVAFSYDDFDIAVGPNDNAHLLAATDGGIEYLTGTNAPTTFGPKPTSVVGARAPSIAVDSSGTVWAAWYRAGSIELASLSGTTWSTPTVVATASAGAHTDLAVDSANRLHLVFGGCDPSLPGSPCGVRYGVRVGTSWGFQTLRPGTSINASYLALHVGAGGEAAVAASTKTKCNSFSSSLYCTFLFVP